MLDDDDFHDDDDFNINDDNTHKVQHQKFADANIKENSYNRTP